MIELSKIKYCPDLDEGYEMKDNKDKKIKLIEKKYIIDVKYEKIGKKEVFIVYCDDYDYSTSKVYLWQRKLTNYVLGKGYKKIIFKINYVNLDLEHQLEFSKPIKYPEDRLLAGEYCKKCVNRKDCPELEEAFLGDFHMKTDTMNDEQLFNIYTLASSRKKAITEMEKQVKDIIYNKIDEKGGALILQKLGLALEKKKIEKDTITYEEARALGLADNDTVSVKIKPIKDKMKEDKILASKVKFKKEPFRTELLLKNI